MDPDIRDATRADVRALGEMLTRAFWDDPMTEWLLPDERSRSRRVRPFWRSLVRMYIRSPRPAFVAGDALGCAMWSPPAQWRATTAETLRKIPVILPGVGRGVGKMIRLFRETERRHPKEEHWYLGLLATDPGHQGQGIGSSLILTMLSRADGEGLPAYLETSKERNVAFYGRHGFEVVDQFTINDSPPMWLMWREPRPA